MKQYEISNWAKPGRTCRHNLTYWRDEPYVAIGAGAAGWVDGRRTKNTPSPKRYMASVAAGQVDYVEDERPGLLTRLGDALAVGLRLREGLDLAALSARLGLDVKRLLGSTLDELIAAGVALRLRAAACASPTAASWSPVSYWCGSTAPLLSRWRRPGLPHAVSSRGRAACRRGPGSGRRCQQARPLGSRDRVSRSGDPPSRRRVRARPSPPSPSRRARS